MTARAAAFAAIVTGLAPAEPAAQFFRSGTDAVLVDVSVRRGGRPVLGLGVGDFELLDSGVKQSVVLVSAEQTMPVDLALLVDISYSARHGYGPRPEPPLLPSVRAVLPGFRRLLLPGDRLLVIGFDSRMRELNADEDLAASLAAESGHTTLWDSIATALLTPVDAGRRRVVVVLTDGIDTNSLLDYRTLWAIADRTDAVLYLFLLADRRYLAPAGIGEPFGEFSWFLENAARRTGGRAYDMQPTDDVVALVKEALVELRQRYLLRYVPAGVAAGGWHPLDVRVTRSGRYDVQARKGYTWR